MHKSIQTLAELRRLPSAAHKEKHKDTPPSVLQAHATTGRTDIQPHYLRFRINFTKKNTNSILKRSGTLKKCEHQAVRGLETGTGTGQVLKHPEILNNFFKEREF